MQSSLSICIGLLVLSCAQIRSSSSAQNACTGNYSSSVSVTFLFESGPDCEAESNINILPILIAAEWIISQANSGLHPSLTVSGVTYGIDYRSVCSNRSLAVKLAGESIDASVWKSNMLCLKQELLETENSRIKPLHLGFLGPLQSSNAEAVASFLTETRIPMISPTASLADLGNKTKYGTFIRTIPSDNLQAKIMVRIAADFDWRYITLVYSDDLYGRQGAKLVREYAELAGICVAGTHKITQETDMMSVITDLLEKYAPTAIIYFGQHQAFVNFLSVYIQNFRLNQGYPKRVFLTSEAVAVSTDVRDKLRQAQEGYIPEQLELVTVAQYSRHDQFSDFDDYFTKRYENSLNGSAIIERIVEAYKVKCQATVRGCTPARLLEAANKARLDSVMKATLVHLKAFKSTHDQLCEKGTAGFCDNLKNMDEFYAHQLININDMQTLVELNSTSFQLAAVSDNARDPENYTKPAYSVHIMDLDINYKQVGLAYTDGSVIYEHADKIHDYASSSYCGSPCSTCGIEEPPYVFKKGNSSLLIIGSGSTREAGDGRFSCGDVLSDGFYHMQAFYFAIQQIETMTSISFNTIYIDFCLAADMRAHNILGSIFNSSSGLSIHNNGEVVVFPYDKVVAAVGALASDMSNILQGYLKIFDIPQISYASTSPKIGLPILDPTFMRNVPNDSQQASKMVEIAHKAGIKQLGLIHSETLYGMAGAEAVRQAVDATRGICITDKMVLQSQSEADIARVVKMLTDDEHEIQAFIFFGHDFLIKGIIKALDTDPRKRVWTELGRFFILCESWGMVTHQFVKAHNDLLKGSIFFSLDPDKFSWTATDGTKPFHTYIDKLQPEDMLNDHLFLYYWQNNFQCSISGRYDIYHGAPCGKNTLPNGNYSINFEEGYMKHMVMAVYGIGFTILDAKSEGYCDGDCFKLFQKVDGDFLKRLLQTVITGQVISYQKSYRPRNLAQFDANRNGLSYYAVYNIDSKEPYYEKVYTVKDRTIIQEEGRELNYYPGGKVVRLANTDFSKCHQLETEVQYEAWTMGYGEFRNLLEQQTRIEDRLLAVGNIGTALLFISLFSLLVYAMVTLYFRRKCSTNHKPGIGQKDHIEENDENAGGDGLQGNGNVIYPTAMESPAVQSNSGTYRTAMESSAVHSNSGTYCSDQGAASPIPPRSAIEPSSGYGMTHILDLVPDVSTGQ